ncbi:MAG: cytidylate kinase-like family protein [Oscillibacter sp.]|nr:cytidylate kinase-like family protein [Oscillibacter sp.]
MKKVITISREYGAGGHSIGQRVAQELGIPFYDRDIVQETVKASGFDLDLVEEEGEDISKASSIFKSICAITSSNYQDPQNAIHDVQQAVVLRFAQEGPCVILGRCADDTMQKAGIDCLNVFIHADDVSRAMRVSEMTGSKNGAEIRKLMAKKDDSRHTYYHRYTGKTWGDSRNYHLTLDSGVLGYDLCVKLICEAAKED